MISDVGIQWKIVVEHSISSQHIYLLLRRVYRRETSGVFKQFSALS